MSSTPTRPNPFAAHDPYAGAGAAAPAAAPAEGPLVYDVTEADFQARVLERSLQVPVLLDCWAPWCGPCKSLGPMLERITESYGGAFELAKIDTDQAPNLSAALRIRSIPLVVLFIGGRPVDQFTGALPEGQIRAFLDKHLQPPADPMEEIRAEAAQATPDEAESLLIEALAMAPGHPDASADLAERLLARQAPLDDVTAVLDRVAPQDRGDRDAGLRKRMALLANKPPGRRAGAGRAHRRQPARLRGAFRPGGAAGVRRRLQVGLRPPAGGSAARQGRRQARPRAGAQAADRVVRRLPRPRGREPRAPLPRHVPELIQARPASSSALPPAAAVFTVTVCSAQKR